jgi:hypothetical protein
LGEEIENEIRVRYCLAGLIGYDRVVSLEYDNLDQDPGKKKEVRD